MGRIPFLLFIFSASLSALSCGISGSLNHRPEMEGYNQELPSVQKHADTLFTSGQDYLLKNRYGIWEMKVSGDPLELGLKTGILTQELLLKQEEIFFSKVGEMVPSRAKQKLLRQFLKWYNRKLHLHVPEEYKTEIYGLSRYATDKFNHIAPKYLRSLYLHAAHDIGHALQDLALVGCSSLAVWDEKSEDGSLLIGRNFDFYVDDAFAENKIIAFVNPEKGHSFMSVNWAGMIGVVSGMNSEGLTVTINAGKSDIPLTAKTPISIVAREILQYARNIEEAIAIAKKREVFVSEAIMVGSAVDKRAVVIEVAPDNFGVYNVVNSDRILCSNHFQSDAFASDKRNVAHIKESHSMYRMERMQELLQKSDKLSPLTVAAILRNREGLDELSLGYGNEKALNQLLAHHGIIFKPEERLVWVSARPFQLGSFIAYDLNEVFGKNQKEYESLAIHEKIIPEDPFLETEAYKNFETFRIYDKRMDRAITGEEKVTPGFISEYQSLNPDFWEVYYKTGVYYYQNGYYKAAEIQFSKALEKEVTTLTDEKTIKSYLKKAKRKTI